MKHYPQQMTRMQIMGQLKKIVQKEFVQKNEELAFILCLLRRYDKALTAIMKAGGEDEAKEAQRALRIL